MKHYLTVAALSLAVSSAHAAAVFTDNFDTNPLGTNTLPAGWTVSAGTVDTIGPGFYDLIPGNGRYVDLDGSSSSGGVLATSLALTAGTQYIATFQLGGNHRNGTSDIVDVVFGTTLTSYTVLPGDGFNTYSLLFTADTTSTYTLSFHDLGNDQRGALLDNVSVAAVPEPSTLAMLLGGLAMTALTTLRRRSN